VESVHDFIDFSLSDGGFLSADLEELSGFGA